MREVEPHGKYFEMEERGIVNELVRGRTNAVDTITLDLNSATTVVSDPRVSPFSRVFLFPRNSDAAAEVGAGTLWIDTYDYQTYTINHANNALTRTFSVLIMTGSE